MSPLTQGLNYGSACDSQSRLSINTITMQLHNLYYFILYNLFCISGCLCTSP